ncbi:MAG: DNA polymerase III subunit alpha [Gemmataceae bacterium]|nr:DNA polymerase III subunit alpha [Gemmataceae bacterium]MDW8265234.1 DNA polymerase III subunit alpha [Gemmataceae bacterium]
MDRPFVHLHCHTHYSLLDGASRIPELVDRVHSLGMNAVAITDHGNLYGAIEFYKACRAKGIKPIIGYEAYVAPGKRTDREARRRGDAGYHLTLLAQNHTGFRNLIKLASIAFLEGYHYVPRIDKELLAAHQEGIICLSGCAAGEFSEHILNDRLDEAEEVARWFAKVFGNRFYIEIQNNGLEVQKRCAEVASDIAGRLGLPLVATSDAHYLRQEDHFAHDVLLCINTGKSINDEHRLKYGSDQFHVRSPEEMYPLFPGQEDAVRRTQEIADRCDLQLDFSKRHFPVFTPPAGKKPEDYLRELCESGLRQRYGPEPPPAAVERLRHELAIICRMGFASYFLIVWDFVRFARERGIPAGARGSACGALVSYVLQLSHVDPLEYDLLFERFLDPNRSEAPDIDIDFCQDRREEVIAYVRRKYGEQSVAQIATFGTLAARAAVRDVGRVLDLPLARVDQLAKMIPQQLDMTLDKALQLSPELKREYDTDPVVKRLIDIARTLEGTNRNVGTHAAGVVISHGPLVEHVPLQRVVRKGEDAQRDDNQITTQWVMGDLEAVGLLKMDFLGLRTLTVLDNAVKLIAKTRGKTLDLSRLPLDDAATFALLQRGDAKGVFQFESEGIRELLKRMRPDSIRDLIAANALYRPGPLGGGMVDAYINRKHGRETPHYPHPVMEEILGETYGVMCYQEQVMRLLNRLGGIELSSAYACIKAISKKKQEIIDQRRAEFVQGAVARGLSQATAEEIFDLITHFGGYGFNKSHSAAYALLGYQTAYLKAHYPAEFMAALLSSEIEDGNKRDVLVEHIEDARRLGCPVQMPNINECEANFTVRGGQILFGLTAIKGVGRSAVDEIVRARTEKGPFRDLFDFCERVDLKIVNRAVIERLIKAGAFDVFGGRRAQLMHVLPQAIQAASDLQADRKSGQRNFFEVFDRADPAGSAAQPLPDVPEWSDAEKLRYEKEVLDFYFSSHPLAQYETELRGFATHVAEQLRELEPNQEVILGGMLTQARYLTAKRSRTGNSRYLRFRLEDLTGSVECVCWPDDFARHKGEISEDRPYFVRGVVERNRDEPGLVISRILTLDEAKRELARGLALWLTAGVHHLTVIDSLAQLLQQARGPCPVFLYISDTAGRKAELRLGEEYHVNPARLDLAELERLLGRGRVRLVGAGNGGGRNGR